MKLIDEYIFSVTHRFRARFPLLHLITIISSVLIQIIQYGFLPTSPVSMILVALCISSFLIQTVHYDFLLTSLVSMKLVALCISSFFNTNHAIWLHANNPRFHQTRTIPYGFFQPASFP